MDHPVDDDRYTELARLCANGIIRSSLSSSPSFPSSIPPARRLPCPGCRRRCPTPGRPEKKQATFSSFPPIIALLSLMSVPLICSRGCVNTTMNSRNLSSKMTCCVAIMAPKGRLQAALSDRLFVGLTCCPIDSLQSGSTMAFFSFFLGGGALIYDVRSRST